MFGDVLFRYRRRRERNMFPDDRLQLQLRREERYEQRLEKNYESMMKKVTKKSEDALKLLHRQVPQTRSHYYEEIMEAKSDIAEIKEKREGKISFFPWPIRQLIEDLEGIYATLKSCEKELKRMQLSRFQHLRMRFHEFMDDRAEQRRADRIRREDEVRANEIRARVAARYRNN